MTDVELKILAIDIINEKVFGSWMIPKDHAEKISNIFLPLSIGAVNYLPDDVWALYEYRDKSLPMAYEGMPVFSSCKYLQKDDVEKLAGVIESYSQCLSDFLKKDDFDEHSIPDEAI